MKEINELTGEEAAAELAHIAREMAKADIAYYQNDNPYLTDAEYDSLKKRNEEIEARFPELIREDSPSKKNRRTAQNRIRQNSPSFSHAFSGRRLQP